MTLPRVKSRCRCCWPLRLVTRTSRLFGDETIEDLDQTSGDLDHAKTLIAKHHALAGTVEAAEQYGRRASDALARLAPSYGDAQDIREALQDVIAFCIVRGH